MTGLLILSVIALMAVVVRSLPAIIWSLRCPRDARHYRCPPLPGQRTALSGLHGSRRG